MCSTGAVAIGKVLQRFRAAKRISPPAPTRCKHVEFPRDNGSNPQHDRSPDALKDANAPRLSAASNSPSSWQFLVEQKCNPYVARPDTLATSLG